MSSIFFPFPLPLNKKQWLYLIVPQCVLAGIIDGGANFGIAYAMYHGQDKVRMWVFKDNTIAGDLGVTCLIQTAASMLITSTLVHTDLHSSAIAPLPFVYPHVSHLPDPQTLLARLSSSSKSPTDDEKHASGTAPPNRGIKYYWLMLMRFIFEGTENNILLERVPVGTWFKRLLWTAVQGLGLGVIFGFPLWCLAVLILGPIYGNRNMGNKWAPEVIKLVYALILGVITNPVIAILALGSQAQHHLIPLSTPPIESSPSPPQSPSAASRRRPSFTANTSLLLVPRPETPVQPQSPAMLAPPSPSFFGPSSPGLQPPSTPGRPRAKTNASETVSLYSLGGTGGRAQRANRPRAGSRASALSAFPPPSPTAPLFGGDLRLGAPLGSPAPEGTRSERSGSMTSELASPVNAWAGAGRERSGSVASYRPGRAPPGMLSMASGGELALGRVQQLQASELEAPRESLELTQGDRPQGEKRE